MITSNFFLLVVYFFSKLHFYQYGSSSILEFNLLFIFFQFKELGKVKKISYTEIKVTPYWWKQTLVSVIILRFRIYI